MTLLDPDSWTENGGDGVVRLVNGLLIVKQSYHLHRDVEELLQQLRDARGVARAG